MREREVKEVCVRVYASAGWNWSLGSHVGTGTCVQNRVLYTFIIVVRVVRVVR